jgi:mxaA protein
VACLILLGLSLLGLIYILGSRAWLPLMGRPFAQASKKLRKLSAKDPEHLKTALSIVHKAINTTANYSVFSDNIDAFLTHLPSFKVVETELGQFFALSHQVFFDAQSSVSQDAKSLFWLKNFCKQCRDCERGLKPAKQKKA